MVVLLPTEEGVVSGVEVEGMTGHVDPLLLRWRRAWWLAALRTSLLQLVCLALLPREVALPASLDLPSLGLLPSLALTAPPSCGSCRGATALTWSSRNEACAPQLSS